MSATDKKQDRNASIQDPRQRAVARRMGQICDLFSDRFAALDPDQRLLAVAGSADAGGRVRNLMRPLAVGMAVRMLEDLGVALAGRHGYEAHGGRTELRELGGLHKQSILQCARTFSALLEDKSEIGLMVADRYAGMLARCREEADACARQAPPISKVSQARSKARKATKSANVKSFDTESGKRARAQRRKASAAKMRQAEGVAGR